MTRLAEYTLKRRATKDFFVIEIGIASYSNQNGQVYLLS